MGGPAKDSQNPYVGPRPFARSDADRFFGREEETADLASLVAAHPLLLLYAESGAGKTSLINAGVIPRLEAENFEVLPVIRFSAVLRDRAAIVATANLFVLAVVRAILSPLPTNTKDIDGLSIRRSLQLARVHAGDPTPRVLVIDQFEELFTANKERWKERDDFFRQIADAVEVDDALHIILGIREDFLAQLDPYSHLLPGRCRVRYRLERLRPKDALAAVRAPLFGTGVDFAPNVAEDMVTKLLKVEIPDTADGLGSVSLNPDVNTYSEEFVEPVQLQVACFNCYRNLPEGTVLITASVAETFGNVDRALTDFYEEAIREVTGFSGETVTEATLRTWFEGFITEDETRGLVFRGDTQTESMSNEVVDRLDALHIIRVELRGNKRWYELSHDRFVKPILKSNEVWRRRRDQEARRRYLIRIATLICISLTLLGGVWYWAHQKQKAKDIIIRKKQDEIRKKQDELTTLQNELSETNLRLKLLEGNRGQLEAQVKAYTKEDLRIHEEIERHRSELRRTPVGREILADIDHPRRLTVAPLAVDAPSAAPGVSQPPALAKTAVPTQDEPQKVAEQLVQQQAKAEAVETKINILNHIAESAMRGNPPTVPVSARFDARLVVYAGKSILPNKKRPAGIVPEVYVDGVPYAFVVPFTSFTLDLPPGQHRVCVADAYSPCEEPYAVEVNLQSNASVYLKIATDPKDINYIPSARGAGEADRQHTAFKTFPHDQIINNMPVLP